MTITELLDFIHRTGRWIKSITMTITEILDFIHRTGRWIKSKTSVIVIVRDFPFLSLHVPVTQTHSPIARKYV
jgi:hypothetical protein